MTFALTERAVCLDADHGTTDRRDRFLIPPGIIYLDGNSLGPLPVGVREVVLDTVERQWGVDLIASWNTAKWWDAPTRIGDRLAEIVGAAPGQVICTDSTSVNLFKAIVGSRSLRPGRRVVLTDPASFPTDLYVAQSACAEHDLELELVDPPQAPKRIRALGERLLVAAYSSVDYRTGQLWDLAAITHAAHHVGGLACWDLCHAAGVLDVGLDRHEVDLAVGCGYKYLNGGPGAPAFMYVAHRHLFAFAQPLTGWNGHADPFAMSTQWRPAEGIGRARVGTPPLVSMLALEGALRVYDGLSLGAVRERSLSLTAFFLDCLDELTTGVDVATPREAARRGSQVSLRHPHAYALVRALIARGVIGDFREPDIVRLGFSPLFLSHQDVLEAARRLALVLDLKEFDDPRHQVRSAVT